MQVNDNKLSDAIHLIKNLRLKVSYFIREADKMRRQLESLENTVYKAILEGEKKNGRKILP